MTETLNSIKLSFIEDLRIGLHHSPKFLPSKYIYDDEGSRIFEEIMQLDEYYPTRCEHDILESQKDKFYQLVQGHPFNLVELGAGNGEKTAILLHYFLTKGCHFSYHPIDISLLAIESIETKFRRELPKLEIQGINTDYFEGLKWLKRQSTQRSMVLFMGANIGNLNPERMKKFLTGLYNSLHKDDLVVIGFDLLKDYHIIERAYNDSKGVTGRFQLNLLHRINRELGGTFNLDYFNYYTTFNPFSRGIESFIVSLKEQEVYIAALDEAISFYAYEPLHTEYSFKFRVPEIERFAVENGFSVVHHLFDRKKYFVDTIWQVK